MVKRFVTWSCIWPIVAFALSAVLSTSAARADEVLQVLRGFEIIAEIFPKNTHLNLRDKDLTLVGLGSYLVNSTGCNDCHTHPNWATGGNPFLGQPEQINTDQYMTGGRQFGPVTSANITPDKNGRPAGLTLAGFLQVMRTGHDPRDPPGDLLQVMPWPLYRWKIDRDLTAMYVYLGAIPSRPDNPSPGP
jgi:hypothetical protein